MRRRLLRPLEQQQRRLARRQSLRQPRQRASPPGTLSRHLKPSPGGPCPSLNPWCPSAEARGHCGRPPSQYRASCAADQTDNPLAGCRASPTSSIRSCNAARNLTGLRRGRAVHDRVVGIALKRLPRTPGPATCRTRSAGTGWPARATPRTPAGCLGFAPARSRRPAAPVREATA